MNISVVMATYNGAKYLSEQLESILQQSVSPSEIIVVDDCSNDNGQTVGLLRHYENSYSKITVIENERNLGWQKNFINATKIAKGDYIFFADQDDIWDVKKIEKMIHVFQHKKSVNAVACNYTFIDGNGNAIERVAEYTRNTGNVKEFCFDEHFILTKRLGCALGIKKLFADKYINYWSEMFPHDQFFEMLATIFGGFYLIEEPLIKHRIHGNNTDVMHVFDSLDRQKKQNAINTQLTKMKNLELFNSLGEDKKDVIYDYILFSIDRENALKSNSFIKWGALLKRIKYYPSIKTYFGDLKSIFNSKK